jgi:hypothetical protein
MNRFPNPPSDAGIDERDLCLACGRNVATKRCIEGGCSSQFCDSANCRPATCESCGGALCAIHVTDDDAPYCTECERANAADPGNLPLPSLTLQQLLDAAPELFEDAGWYEPWTGDHAA